MLLKFTARQAHSCVAQWQSIRLLIGRLLVRVQPQELIARSPSLTGWGSAVFWCGCDAVGDHLNSRSGSQRSCVEDDLPRVRDRAGLVAADAGVAHSDRLGELLLVESGAAQKRCDKFPSLLPQDVSRRSQADQKEAA